MPRGDIEAQEFFRAMDIGGHTFASLLATKAQGNAHAVGGGSQEIEEANFHYLYGEYNTPAQNLDIPLSHDWLHHCGIEFTWFCYNLHGYENTGYVGPWSHFVRFESDFRVEDENGTKYNFYSPSRIEWPHTNQGNTVAYDGVTDFLGTSGHSATSPELIRVSYAHNVARALVPNLHVRNDARFVNPVPPDPLIETSMRTKWVCRYRYAWVN